MAGPLLTTDAFVLHKWPPTDTFQTFTVFTGTHGALRVLQRIPKKAAGSVILDLFDEVTLFLEGAPQGDAWFAKDTQLLARHTGIGRNYEALVQACAFATFIARNPGAEESHPAVYALLRTVFPAFATSDRPDIVHLKSLYRFAREEGLPVKQEWFPALSSADRQLAITLINRPLSGQTAAAADVARLESRLKHYLSTHADLHTGP